MNTHPFLHSSVALLAALGVLGAVGPATPARAQVDTSQWKCATCPYPKGSSGAVEAGAVSVSDTSRRFGDYSGLDREGVRGALQAELSHRGDGTWVDLRAGDNFDRTIEVRGGVEGVVGLRLDAMEIPRRFGDGARTPFTGAGSDRLVLPAGFAATTTAGMPLATTLQGIGLGYDHRRLDLGASAPAGPFTVTIGARRDVREGTRPIAASFFNTAAQLPAPVDHTTDQFEVAVGYATRDLQARLAWQYSRFDNGSAALVWDNPFDTGAFGATRGRIALAPDNEFQQVSGAAGYQVAPAIRASADFALGRATQNEPLLPTSVTAGLVLPLPAAGIDGRVDTFAGNVRLTAAVPGGVRLVASYSRDERNNRTAVLAWPQVATDLFVSASAPVRSNTPFDEMRDRFRLQADWRRGTLRLAAGLEQDNRTRNYHEAVRTRETSAYARATVAAGEGASLAFKLSYGDRDHDAYGVATWFGTTENTLLRKYELAQRRRTAGSARGDFAVGDNVALGVTLEAGEDEYPATLVGLRGARRTSLGGDVAWTIDERTRLTAWAQSEAVVSRQAGSQVVAAPDWNARGRDRFDVVGIGFRHALIPDRLDVGADAVISRARSQLRVDTGIGDPAFPVDRMATDTIKVYASYKLSDSVSLNGGLWSERGLARDWRLDGVGPATLPNLLAFGVQPADYRVYVLRASVRYRF